MDAEKWLCDQLMSLERQWSLGKASALDFAFNLCTWNDRPLPQWLADAVRRGEVPSQLEGKRGSETMMQVHLLRWDMAKYGRQLGRKGRKQLKGIDYKPHGKASAADVFASDMLRGSAAWGSPTQTHKSFQLVEAAIEAGDWQESIGGTAVRVPKRIRVAKRSK